MLVEKKVKRTPWLAVVLIGALSILNLLLIRQNFSLRQQLTAGSIEASADSLKPGEVVTTPIAGTDLKGQPYQMQYRNDGKRYLLMFFSPQLSVLYPAGADLG